MTAREPALAAVGAILDQAVALDAEAPERLRQLQGQPLEIAIQGLDLAIQLVPEGEHMRLTMNPEQSAAARISGPPASLAALAGREGTRVLFAGDLQVSGDVTVARAYKRLFDTLDPDWEEALAQLTGDIPAHEAARLAAVVAAWARRARAGRAADLRAWLIAELELLPARAEVTPWLAAVDRARHDADRLAARIARLQRRLEDP